MLLKSEIVRNLLSNRITTRLLLPSRSNSINRLASQFDEFSIVITKFVFQPFQNKPIDQIELKHCWADHKNTLKIFLAIKCFGLILANTYKKPSHQTDNSRVIFAHVCSASITISFEMKMSAYYQLYTSNTQSNILLSDLRHRNNVETKTKNFQTTKEGILSSLDWAEI